jgi:two-component system sensor histidine kinase QseC
MPSKSTFIICAASLAVNLSAPCTASVIPWVTHETDPTPEPEAAPDAALLVLSLTAWFAASLVAWQQTTHKLDKLFDTQQMLFAKRLLTMDLDEIRPKRMRDPQKVKHGRLDDDALAFAIYTPDGKMLLNDGENGRDIPYHYRRDGFDNGQLKDDNDEWRFLWLTSPDGKYRVVVGQEWEYRQEMALDIVSSQLTPWLVALPVMLLLLIVLLSRELKPLKKLARPCARARRMPPTRCRPGCARGSAPPARLAESSVRAPRR